MLRWEERGRVRGKDRRRETELDAHTKRQRYTQTEREHYMSEKDF